MKGVVYRSIVVSIIIAALTSTVSMVISTLQARTFILKGAHFEQLAKKADDTAMAQYVESVKKNESIVDRIVKAFSFPGFWLLWFKAFLYIAISVFLGCISIITWYQKRPAI